MTEEINLSFKNLNGSDIFKLAEDFAARQFPLIRIIKLGYNNLGDEGAAVVSKFLSHNRTVTCVDLGFNRIGDAGMQCIATALPLNRTLEVLYLSGNFFTSIGFQYLSDGIARNNSLKALYLTGNNAKDVGAKFLAEGLLRNNSVTKLYLNGNRIGSKGCDFISKLLMQNATLRHINLSDNSISDEGMIALSEALVVNKYLKEIELSFNSITHIGMQRFCDVLNYGYSSMVRLLLDNNKLGDNGAKCLAGSLLKLNIIELNIGFNGIEPEGLIEIVNAIYRNPTIESLTLSGNNITNTVAKVIANMLLHNYNLRQLFLDHANIGPVGEKYISAGIATNKRSGVRLLTGFHLGKVLVTLGSPPHLNDVSNDTALTHLSMMWAAQNLQEQHHQQNLSQRPDIVGSDARLPSPHAGTAAPGVLPYPINPVDNRLPPPLSSTAPASGAGPRTNYPTPVAPVGGTEVFVAAGAVDSNEVEVVVYPSPEKTLSSSSIDHTDADSKSISNSSDVPVPTFPFLNRLNDQLTGKEGDIDIVLSYADRDRIMRSISYSVDINIMNISISPPRISVSNQSSPDNKDSPKISELPQASYAVPTSALSTDADAGNGFEVAVPSLQGASCLVPVHLQDITKFAKGLSAKPFNAAELWELHQYYYSPPSEATFGSNTSSSRSSSSDEDNDDDESRSDSRRYDHLKNRIAAAATATTTGTSNNVSTVVATAAATINSSSHSRKRRATISTMVRIAQYPKVKEYLNTHKSDNEEAKLTLLRQLKYLENCGADLHDTALESLLLDEIFNQ